jgi:hypothetical protein
MQHIHHQKQTGVNQNEAGIETANKFTWRNTAEQLLKVIDI